MPHNAQDLLDDIVSSVRLIQSYADGKTFADFTATTLLRDAIERPLIPLGEARVRLKANDADMFKLIPDARSYIGFKNILVHQYDGLDAEIVWNTVEKELPLLREHVEALVKPPTISN